MRLMIAVTFVAMLWTLPVVHAKEPLRVGAAEVDITPPVGFRKGGGYSEVISTGVHDPLYAKAIVLQLGDLKFALVICDLLSVPERLSTQARKLAEARTAIPVANIVIAATHNHGSPEYCGPLRDIFHDQAIAATGADPHEQVDYQQLLVNACVEAIARAHGQLRDATAKFCETRQEGLAFNRRFHMRDGSVRFNPGKLNPDIIRVAGPVDDELPCLSFHADPDGPPLTLLTIFAMHTATFGGTEFGADFPGHLQSNLRTEFGEGFLSLFGEGTAGDVNHVDVRSADPQSSDVEPRRIGEVLSRSLRAAMPMAKPVGELSLAVRSTRVEVPIVPVSEERYRGSIELLAKQAEQPTPFLDLVAAWRDCHRWEERQRHGDLKPFEVQAVRFSADIALVTLPHEVFVELGMGIKASSPFRHTLVLSLANDCDYYIPTRRAFEEGSYEVTTCPLAPGCGEKLATAAIGLLEELKRAD